MNRLNRPTTNLSSLNKLGLEYVDLYLVHWPVKGNYKDTWRALGKLYSDGKVRVIGVSNFQIHYIEDLINRGHSQTYG
ncbi:aldo/keto reductase [Paenibacillus sp. FSL K6-0276]|uniref:aldo/keto reductase n=1 Tax=Paenibacillus sp. FSL K6-0276 TaxID=2921450 RepID=UPI0030EE509A